MLKLLNANTAGLYGLPPKDLEESDALKILAHLGENGAKAHLEYAIQSGAFKRERERDSVEVRAGMREPKEKLNG